MSRCCLSRSGFLLCMGVCVFIFLLQNLYSSDSQEGFSPEIKECGFYPGELCTALFKSNPAALGIGNICQVALLPSRDLGPMRFRTPTNCSAMIKELHFITKPLSEEEAAFPLAYILTIHHKLDMFVKLLSAIYAPQNIYYIHIDQKSPEDFIRAVQELAGCFENIFFPSRQENVVYAGFSRLQADINCMKDLIRSDNKWRYVINLCGQDFPIKTNREIIRYLKTSWRGRNLTPGVVQPPHMKYRTNVSYKVFQDQEKSYVYPTATLKSRPPHNLTLYFGTAYYALTRNFVRFVLSDPRAKDLLEWSRDAYSPDEHYWVTLNRLKDAPGSTPEAQWEGNIRAVKWKDQEGSVHSGCNGRQSIVRRLISPPWFLIVDSQGGEIERRTMDRRPVAFSEEERKQSFGHYVRDICIYGLGDLQWLANSPQLFANKFDPDTYPLVTDCLERSYRSKVLKATEVPTESHWYFHDDYVAT